MPIKLAIFDVDGTLLRGDTACLWIARKINRYERMKELENSSTKQQVADSQREMAGWYTGMSPEYLMGDMKDFPWAPGIHEGIKMLQDAGVTVALASIGWDFVQEKIASLFGIEHILASTLDFETLEIGHALDVHKAEYANKLSGELNIPLSQIAGIGDRPNDFYLLESCGLGIYVGPKPPPPDKHFTHLPNADIRDVATAIIG